MRMPIFSYFLVMGTVLAGLIIWLGSETQSNDSALKTSQVVGLPKPFKPPPEPAPYRITGVNFAAGREAPATKTTKAAEKPGAPVRRQKWSTNIIRKCPFGVIMRNMLTIDSAFIE